MCIVCLNDKIHGIENGSKDRALYDTKPSHHDSICHIVNLDIEKTLSEPTYLVAERLILDVNQDNPKILGG